MIEEASLYIHVPFCHSRCDYCDFYSVPVPKDSPLKDAYIARLLQDAEFLFARHPLRRVPSVYIGGGTPSALGEGRIARLLDGVSRFLPDAPLEYTVEANGESTGIPFLSALKPRGVTRLSLGVQTFDGSARRAVGRTGGDPTEALSRAAAFFPGGLAADLLTGLPGQDEEAVCADIERLLAFSPAHISLYALTLAEGTPLARRHRAGRGVSLLPSPETADRLWLTGKARLERAGFSWYEIANFARRGAASLHNTRYWRMENWLSLGPSSSSTVIDDASGTGVRRTVTADLYAWLNRKPGEAPPFREEALDRITLKKEMFLMGFRTEAGPPPELWEKRFGSPLPAASPRVFSLWRSRGLLRKSRAALTKRGRLVLGRFLPEAFLELEERESGPAGP
ncbi:MAG: coproporphyrinogen III oxidase family protein [Spirochaetaceae bacterium]|jgi:oxygen-independent coproporphyrinogen-3 oxidase|nr:coproporphyrinogen III oxidase family protein [Spirochaetaceae bacterium]